MEGLCKEAKGHRKVKDHKSCRATQLCWPCANTEASEVDIYPHCQVGMKMVGNGRKNVLTIPAPVFFVGNRNGNGKAGQENETGIMGYRERNISSGNVSIMTGKR